MLCFARWPPGEFLYGPGCPGRWPLSPDHRRGRGASGPGLEKTEGLSVIQQAFLESGAIQCGYCTPAMVLAAQSLLAETLNPSEDQIREVFSGILCRCTGYQKPVQAVLRAAAVLRGETVTPIRGTSVSPDPVPGGEPAPDEWLGNPPSAGSIGGEPLVQPGRADVTSRTKVLPKIWTTPGTVTRQTVGKPEIKVMQ